MEAEKKLLALKQFAVRKDYSGLLQKLDEHGKHHDSAECVYCRYCGTPVEIVVREPVFPVRRECSQCESLEQNGWLEDAINFHEGV